MKKSNKRVLFAKESTELLTILEQRFAKNLQRHRGIKWADVLKKLAAAPEKLWSLNEMEKTGGEPDVVAYDQKTKEYTFSDCCTESPLGRRSICYDLKALKSRKENQPANTAMDMAEAMGIEILNEEQYRKLQKLGSFDLKTSSWIKTPTPIRDLGGAIFCDRRYDNVFVYHNGAESYYAARGFRGELRV